MNFYSVDTDTLLKEFNSDENLGLKNSVVIENANKFGKNILTKKKGASIFSRIFSCLKEPMILILIFGLILTLGVNIGRELKNGSGDFYESIGIFLAIFISVFITLFMEGTSKKAFDALNKVYDNYLVKVIRNGTLSVIKKEEVVVGDIILLDSGDKIIADGRLIASNSLSVNESALTGESALVKKQCGNENNNANIFDRKNCVFSSSFVSSGSGKMLVCSVGDNTEIGKIAREITSDNEQPSPLNIKLNKLGKIITIIGVACSIVVFLLSLFRLISQNNLTFYNFQELFISAIILIVAAVPEGLPTIVAVSLALNMIKLSKENALIKKMIATETAGAVSVICTDKTGTLTQNKMTLEKICVSENCLQVNKNIPSIILDNFALNSTAKFTDNKFIGSATEIALLSCFKLNNKTPLEEYRKKFPIISRTPFSSDIKYMETTVKINNETIQFIKGAGEIVLKKTSLSALQQRKILFDMEQNEKMARRIICFAHRNNENELYHYDGFASLFDPVKPDVLNSVLDCKRAGIRVKMLTGDNLITAFAIAKELKIADNLGMVIEGAELDKMDDKTFLRTINKVSVIARSTPLIKLRVVKALKSAGDVVAVTGDGINDAPAIKHADIGIAMGIAGSEITKEAADCVLLDDSFNSVVKAIFFGRNVYKNLQRFILFQLSVNFSALFIIMVICAFNLPSPFNTLELLFINVIMDGPPAITLGLEPPSKNLLSLPPVKKNQSILTFKMLLRILFNSLFISAVLLMQYFFNFLKVSEVEKSGVIFTLFILFQLFNAFNSRKVDSESVFNNLRKNKIMLFTFLGVFVALILIVNVLPSLFNISSLSFLTWVKCLMLSSSILVITEIAKLVYRKIYLSKNSV